MSKHSTTAADSVDRLLRSQEASEQYVGADPTYMGIISRIFRVYARLDRNASAIFEKHGLTRGEADVLATLYRENAPMAPSILAESLLCSPGAMTNRLQNLEREGLVERHTHPDDRRAVGIELTRDGKRRIRAAIEERKAAHERLIPGLSEAEREQLVELLRTLLGAMERAE
jgi:DNA-binding MarR family transcriptional regulator